MAVTANDVKNAQKELEAALRAVSLKTGFNFTLGRITYNTTSFRCKLEGTDKGAASPEVSAVDRKAQDLVTFGKHFLPAAFDLNKYYLDLNLGRVKIVGYNARAKAYPFIVVTMKGKRYKTSQATASRMVTAGAV